MKAVCNSKIKDKEFTIIPQTVDDNMSVVEKIRKSGNDLIISIPMEICENLNLKEGSQVEIELFFCSGEAGARIRPIKESDQLK